MDDIEKLKSALEEIPIESNAAKLKKLMPTIHQRLLEGISQEVIIRTLSNNGLEINHNTFRTHLYRYRKKLNFSKSSENSNFQKTGSIDKKIVSNAPSLEELLDPKKREGLGEKYAHLKSPLFKNSRNSNETCDN